VLAIDADARQRLRVRAPRDRSHRRRRRTADPPKRLVYLDVDDALEVFGSIADGLRASDRELANWIIGFSAGASPREVAMAIRRLTTAGSAVRVPRRPHGCDGATDAPQRERCQIIRA
jgi:hypothetical protein